MPTREEILTRALSYPYPRPPHSFLHPCPNPALTSSQEAEYLSSPTLTAVLAIGSNAAPSQLLRKFGTPAPSIPVLAVRCTNLDVVYAAYVSAYGSLAATVIPSPGTTLLTHVTLLSAQQLARMHETEASAYALVRLQPGVVGLRSGDRALEREVFAYVAYYGLLRGVGGKGIAIRELAAVGRVLVECDQREAQLVCRDAAVQAGVLEKGESVEEFVLRNVADEGRRKRILDKLGGEVCAPVAEHVWTILRML